MARGVCWGGADPAGIHGSCILIAEERLMRESRRFQRELVNEMQANEGMKWHWGHAGTAHAAIYGILLPNPYHRAPAKG